MLLNFSGNHNQKVCSSQTSENADFSDHVGPACPGRYSGSIQCVQMKDSFCQK